MHLRLLKLWAPPTELMDTRKSETREWGGLVTLHRDVTPAHFILMLRRPCLTREIEVLYKFSMVINIKSLLQFRS